MPRPMTERLLRVQATWTVDSEPFSYAPIFVSTREHAEAEAAEIRRTLSHFPTLEVTLEEVTADEAVVEQELLRSPKTEAQPLHLVDTPLSSHTACGLSTASVNFAVAEIFEISGAACPSCEAVRRRESSSA